MGCAIGIVKYLVFLANLLFALAGLGMVIVGVMYKFNYSDATKVLPSEFAIAPILSIIIGAIVFVTAFLGCCGAVKESSCMLTTYSIVLLTIFIIQVAIGVYAFLQVKDTGEFRSELRRQMQKTFDARSSNNQEAREAVDVAQTVLECCGVDNYNEMQLPNGSLPLSCCKRGSRSCQSTDFNSVHRKGCAEALYMFLENSSQVVGWVAIGIAAIEVIGAIFGLCLASSIRNHYRRNIYT